MVAMDVVDTVRHQQLIVDRELDAEGRRQRLIERLRDIYDAQGIEVTDAALEAGVDALEEGRFGYTPPPPGFSVSLARIYVRRERWLKGFSILAGLAVVIWLAWLFMVQLPQSRFENALPEQISSTRDQIVGQSRSPAATTRANELMAEAERAIRADNFDEAQRLQGELEELLEELGRDYEIRIVSRPGEFSGIWRVPDLNPDARNYYLIVEAVDARGNILTRSVRNEEDGRMYRVNKWGVRVSEATFEAVAADKRDDGIVEDYVLAVKSAGKLEPEYRVETTGATITEW